MTTILTIRQALKQAREHLAADNVNYLSGPRQYETDSGTLFVRNAPSSDGNLLLGVFEAELVDRRGKKIKTYKI